MWPYLTVPGKWLGFTPALVERTRIDTSSVEPDAAWRSVDRSGRGRSNSQTGRPKIEPETRVVSIQSETWNARTEYWLEPFDDHQNVINMNFAANSSG